MEALVHDNFVPSFNTRRFQCSVETSLHLVFYFENVFHSEIPGTVPSEQLDKLEPEYPTFMHKSPLLLYVSQSCHYKN